MKKIEAIIKPFKLEEVKSALAAVGVEGIMVSELKGASRQKGPTEAPDGGEQVVDLLPKVKMEMILPDNVVSAAMDALVKAARTGKLGDGKVFVIPIEEAVRIRTGESGEMAI